MASGCRLTGAASGTLTRSKACLREGDCARCIALTETKFDLAARTLDTGAADAPQLEGCPEHGFEMHAAPV